VQRVDPYGLVGQVLDGQFRVDAPIGEGGCSVVYRGYHIGLEAPVAIKCLKLQQQLGSAFVQAFEQRFRDESKIQYRLSQGSLHIVRTLAAGTTIAPATSALIPYMVLEWLDGFTLGEQLRARRERGERGRSLAEVLKLLDPVAEAMAFAHSLGVVHRDLNPSNLFVVVAPDGGQRLKVVDFGVAKVVSDNALQMLKRAATLGPIRMFTPAYGAPEQFSETFGVVSPATDVYAFALLLVELLLDRPPIEGDNLADFMTRATDEVLRPTPWSLGCTTVGENVERLFSRALSVDPTRRPTDIGALWGALKSAVNADEELARRRSSQPPPSLLQPQGPTTKKGTLILRPEGNPFVESPSSSSIFAEPTTSSRSGTLLMAVHPGPHPGAGAAPVTIRPPAAGPVADPLAPTFTGEPRQGVSPLSVTSEPGGNFTSPEQRAIIDRYWPPGASAPLSSAPGSVPPGSGPPGSGPPGSGPPGSGPPRSGPPSSGDRPPLSPHGHFQGQPNTTLRSASERPRAPEPVVASPSVPRSLLVGLGIGGLFLLVTGGWLLSRILSP